jgi:PAS domain S-box-containing protein
MTNVDAGKDFSSYDYYRALFENPQKNCVLLLDGSGIVIEVNRAFLLSFGYDAADLIGEHFSMLFTEEDREKELPMREIHMVLDEGQSFDNNYLVNKNNVRTWVSGESVLLHNTQGQKYVLKIIQNIHTQKESEYSIASLNRFNEDILSTIDDGVVVLDQEFKMVKANRSFYRLFQVSEASLRDIGMLKLLNSFDKKNELGSAIAAALGTGNCNSPFQLDFEDAFGINRGFEVSCSRFENQPGKSNVLIVFHDITLRKNQERQREDILTFVAHELRNPLTNIILNIGWMETMMSEEKRDDYREFLERAARNAERLKKLVNELNKSTKLISGNYELQAALCVLDDCISESIDALRQTHPDFYVEQQHFGDIKVMADRDKIMQVLNNYLSNAVKYAGENKRISVSTTVGESSVTVAVTDWGKGIPAKELPFIFNRYYRAEKTRSLEGLGVGLFLCRQIIEAHNGRTWVESVEGKGSTFYFSLPIAGQGRDDKGI